MNIADKLFQLDQKQGRNQPPAADQPMHAEEDDLYSESSKASLAASIQALACKSTVASGLPEESTQPSGSQHTNQTRGKGVTGVSRKSTRRKTSAGRASTRANAVEPRRSQKCARREAQRAKTLRASVVTSPSASTQPLVVVTTQKGHPAVDNAVSDHPVRIASNGLRICLFLVLFFCGCSLALYVWMLNGTEKSAATTSGSGTQSGDHRISKQRRKVVRHLQTGLSILEESFEADSEPKTNMKVSGLPSVDQLEMLESFVPKEGDLLQPLKARSVLRLHFHPGRESQLSHMDMEQTKKLELAAESEVSLRLGTHADKLQVSAELKRGRKLGGESFMEKGRDVTENIDLEVVLEIEKKMLSGMALIPAPQRSKSDSMSELRTFWSEERITTELKQLLRSSGDHGQIGKLDKLEKRIEKELGEVQKKAKEFYEKHNGNDTLPALLEEGKRLERIATHGQVEELLQIAKAEAKKLRKRMVELLGEQVAGDELARMDKQAELNSQLEVLIEKIEARITNTKPHLKFLLGDNVIRLSATANWPHLQELFQKYGKFVGDRWVDAAVLKQDCVDQRVAAPFHVFQMQRGSMRFQCVCCHELYTEERAASKCEPRKVPLGENNLTNIMGSEERAKMLSVKMQHAVLGENKFDPAAFDEETYDQFLVCTLGQCCSNYNSTLQICCSLITFIPSNHFPLRTAGTYTSS